MFCQMCGKEIAGGDKYCPHCGMPVDEKQLREMIEAEDGDFDEMQKYFREESTEVSDSGIALGFSVRADDAEILEAVKKNDRSGFGCAVAGILFPLAIITVGSGLTGELSIPAAIAVGAAASIVLFIFYILYTIQKKIDKPWDGVVTKQYEKRKQKSHRDGDRQWIEEYTECITVFATDQGKKKKEKERSDRSKYYDYLEEGDRVRYHPGFVFRYEKYDKSHDRYLYCPACACINPSANDRCEKCHVPLLK